MDLSARPTQSISNPAQTLSNAAAATNLTNGTTSAPSSSTSTAPTKMTKPAQSLQPTAPVAPRLEVQGFYNILKESLNKEQWTIYTTTMSKYLSGKLSPQELHALLKPFIRGPLVLQHNTFLSSLLANAQRDPPPSEIALWVTSSAPPTAPKPSTDNPAEHQLKREIMSISARERRRLKETPAHPPPNIEDTLNHMLYTYHTQKQISKPQLSTSAAPRSASLSKTNWDQEILVRYTQPLAQETGEMPDVEGMRARLTPICYESGVPAGCSSETASFMSVAAEIFVKEVLTTIISRVRSNGPKYVQTDKYRKRGRGRRWKLEEAGMQRPLLGMHDMRLSLALGDNLLTQLPLSMKKIMAGGWFERDYEVSQDEQFWEGEEEELGDLGWEGAEMSDRRELRGVLDDCLANGA